MIPSKIEFKIGQNIFQQPIRLVRHQTTGGRIAWCLYRDQANQRDDNVFIDGLTDEILLALAEAVTSLRQL